MAYWPASLSVSLMSVVYCVAFKPVSIDAGFFILRSCM